MVNRGDVQLNVSCQPNHFITLNRDFATDKKKQKKIFRWIHLASNLTPVT